jgi:hypothetical protein
MDDLSANGHGEFRNQLDRKTPESHCPFCKSDSWRFGDKRVVLTPVDADGSILIGQGIGVWALFCENCGFVRLHEPDLLMADN